MTFKKKELSPEENLKIFHALDHPVRLKILAFIYDETKDHKELEKDDLKEGEAKDG